MSQLLIDKFVHLEKLKIIKMISLLKSFVVVICKRKANSLASTW